MSDATRAFTDCITLLHADQPQRKRIAFTDGAWTKHGANHVKFYQAVEHKVRNLDDLWHRLTEGDKAGAIAIHGTLNHGLNAHHVTRRNVNFAVVPHFWMAVDFDDLPGSSDDPAKAAAQTRALLPPEFVKAGTLWQASAGHALVPGHARLRLWFWSSRPVSLAEIKAWFRTSEIIEPDFSLWQTVQPIFLSVEASGASDPVRSRWGRLPGGVVMVPEGLKAETVAVVPRGAAVPEGVIENDAYSITTALGYMVRRDLARVEDVGRRMTWRAAALDFFDLAVTEAIILPALACWSFPDDGTERDLADALREAGVYDAVGEARWVRQAGAALDGTWTDDAIAEMVEYARRGRQSPIGSEWKRDPSSALVSVDDPDDAPESDATEAEALRVDSAKEPAKGDVTYATVPDARRAVPVLWRGLYDADTIGLGIEEPAAALLLAMRQGQVALTGKARVEHWIAAARAGEELPPTFDAALRRRPRIETPSIENAPDRRTPVTVNVVRIHAAAELIAGALVERDVDIFVRGRQLVEVVEKPGLRHGAGGIEFLSSLQPITRSGLQINVSKHVRLLSGAEGKEKEIAPPLSITNALFENTHYFDLRPIVQASEGPVLLRDGSIISTKGYDAGSAIYITKELQLPPIVERPSRADALAALALLDHLLDGFEFACPESRSAALSAVLTTTTRNLYDVVPATLCSAPTPGSGKSFLFRLVSEIALGRPGALLSSGRDEAETEKRLDSLLLDGANVVCLDNLTVKIGGSKLCQVIEQPQVEIRALGSTNRITFANGMTVFCTGNNPAFEDDMVRRFMVVRLEPKTERPENRVFDFDPLKRVERDRPRYLAAIFTVLRAWMAARGDGAKVKVVPLASFGEWSDMVRSALIWLDRVDPVETQRQGADITESHAIMSAIFPAWVAAFGDRPITASDAEKAMNEADEETALATLEAILKLHMPDSRRGSTPPLAKRIGYFLRPLKGRVCGGLRLEAAQTRAGTQEWSVAPVRSEGAIQG